MAINPIRFLVVPRVLAMLIMLPVLTVFGNYVGMVGGWSVCPSRSISPPPAYIVRPSSGASAWDLYSGLIKSAVFAWLIITIACYMGLKVEGGAEGVGYVRPRVSGRLVAAGHAGGKCHAHCLFLL